MQTPVRAITFDFFNTLVFHRDGVGRGRRLREYLERQGFTPPPWKHSFLYDMFGVHDAAYTPTASETERNAYYVRLAARVFTTLDIPSTTAVHREHAQDIWRILGPECLAVFPEVPDVLTGLRERRLPLAVVSNWQRGLGHFCYELGLSAWFGCVLASAEVGVARPDPDIFLDACRRLGVAPAEVLHIGDTPEEDYAGARAAGMQGVLLTRDVGFERGGVRVVQTLSGLLDLVAGPDDPSSNESAYDSAVPSTSLARISSSRWRTRPESSPPGKKT